MAKFLSDFNSKILDLDISESAMNTVFKANEGLVKKIKEFFDTMMKQNTSDSPSHILEQCTDFVCSKLSKATNFLRKRDLESNELYVKPKEYALGTRWEMKKVKLRRKKFIKIPRLIQCTFQYVSIVETVQSLFKSKEFKQLYLQYNSTPNHACAEGTYFDFCCGATFQNNIFFKQNSLCLRLQLYVDDFEISNPLSSKSGVHKICAVYFRITNMPIEYSSKLRNIYLVCLCNANDLRTKFTDINNIWRLIFNDCRYLETVGVDIGDGVIIKGALTTFSSDNLGANVGLGFTGSFSASHYCRDCEMPKENCQVKTKIDPRMIRTIESYEKQLNIIDNSVKVDYVETKGVKHHCILNELDNFHCIENPTRDIFHDLNEGNVVLVLKRFFEYCFSIKLFTPEELNYMVQFYDYGWLKRRNVPSGIELEKRSLGQNGSQALCLFQNLPFILYKYKDHPKLQKGWECMISLQQIITILYSNEISENEVDELDMLSTTHLEQRKDCYEQPLTPKEHFLLHYSRTIRLVGPVALLNTARYEAKHQPIKKNGARTKNYRNINKTLAFKHQKQMCFEGFGYKDDIETTKLYPASPTIRNELMSQFVELQIGTESILEVNWLRYNNYEFKKELIFCFGSRLYQIKSILSVDQKYYLLATEFSVLGFDTFLNSYKIEAETNSIVVELNQLKHKKTYEINRIGSSCFVFADTLALKHSITKN